ncbi:MAG: DUF362 domain-containing protein [Candidatus Omnitrophota bacterium]|nr:DUF362 domain-containing protein [Candidatus Omnitrophota bacterium]
MNVGIYKQSKRYYSERPPYFPGAIFPEYPFADNRVDKDNEAYGSLRQMFLLLGLDKDNFGKRSWNPFGSFVFPGDTVLLKPNFMRHFNEKGHGVIGMITHGSIIRAAADYAYIALKGKGRIIIADGPMDDADFEKIARISGLYEIQGFYREKAGFNIEIYDLRQEKVVKRGEKITRRETLKGDPDGYRVVGLGSISAFKKDKLDHNTFRGAECKQEVMSLHHNEARDEYLISGTFLNADAVINIPKLKTHKRAGVTLSLKNLVGVTGDRNWLPHSSEPCGRSHAGKKCFKTAVVKALKDLIGMIRPLRDSLRQFRGVTEATKQAGNWYGNDIMWRTIIDLSHIARYADKKGEIKNTAQRRSFVIVDGIAAGEKDGPTNPSPKPCGVLIAGFNELCVDIACARVMGFDPLKIPKFKNIDSCIKDIKCVSNIKEWDKNVADFKGRCLGFKPHYGWKGHIEAEDK